MLPLPVQDKLPKILSKGSSANLLLLFWILMGGVLLHAFLANFRSMLMKPLIEQHLDTAEEMNERGMIPILLTGGTYWKDILNESPSPAYQQLGERDVTAKNGDEIYPLVKNGIFDATTHVWVTLNLYPMDCQQEVATEG